ncbi:hypothetical protein [Tessaracoccus oleiagri]|uniref:hypothetical protein n=1 Tax=Tessaracoccus oleiagri TaxID=686624 RepID=UPI000B81D73F|nr:hypothetical protein [Tessaracoccus oleiagri]
MIVRVPRGERCPDGCTGVHSYTSDGIRWCWQGADAAREAIDVELPTAPPPAAVAARYEGDEDFWLAWTRLEVVAKLTDTPMLTLVARGDLGRPAPSDIAVEHLFLDGAVVALGRRTT